MMKTGAGTRLLLVCIMTAVVLIAVLTYHRWQSRQHQDTATAQAQTFTFERSAKLSKNEVPSLFQINEEYTRITSQIGDSIVRIETTGSGPDQHGSSSQQTVSVQGLGSGVFVSEEGHIITAHHVIKDKYSLRVTLNNGQSVAVRVIGADPATDIAVLQVINPMRFAPLRFGNSDGILPGTVSLACGNSYGLGMTWSRGIISSRARKVDPNGPPLFQTDAVIFPGNSGGPLVNIYGEIIGIAKSSLNQQNNTYHGVGFAIPANLVKRSFEQIVRYGRSVKGYLGIEAVNMTQWTRAHLRYNGVLGVIVNRVEYFSPAYHEGLQLGDIILACDELEVQQAQDLNSRIAKLSIGDKCRLQIWRNGQQITKTLEMVERSAQPHTAPWDHLLTVLGLEMREFSAEEQALGARGILITADKVSMQHDTVPHTGDILIAVNNTPVNSLPELAQALNQDRFTLTLVRKGKIVQAKGRIYHSQNMVQK